MLSVRTLLGLALLLPALGAPSPAEERLKSFARRFQDPLASAREDAVAELGAADDPRIVDALFKHVFTDEDSRVAEAGVRFLARTGTPGVLDWMKANAMTGKDARVPFYALRTLASLKAPPSAKALEPFTRKEEHWVVRLEAAAALDRIPDEDAVRLLGELMDDASDPVRGMAILGLADHKAARFLPEIRKAVADLTRDWRVRSSALEALETMKDYDSLPLLKKTLAQETELRMKDDLERAVWKWDHRPPEPPKPPADDPNPGSWVDTRPPTAPIDYPARLKNPRTLSRRIVYIMDCSESMRTHASEPPPKPVDDYVVGDDGKPPPPKELSDAALLGYDLAKARQFEKDHGEIPPASRLAFVQRELCRILRSLSPETSFKILRFESAGKQKWCPDPAKAVQFVKTQVPAGETATYDALVSALGFREHDLLLQNAWDSRSCPDTVILFTDGSPNEGEVTQEEEFENSIRRLYRVCRTRIHTVGVGTEDLHLLEHVARITGGRFIRIADLP